VDPVPDSQLHRKFGNPGNQTQDLWIGSRYLWRLDHRSSHIYVSVCVCVCVCTSVPGRFFLLSLIKDVTRPNIFG
jgi:hypothetical protein